MKKGEGRIQPSLTFSLRFSLGQSSLHPLDTLHDIPCLKAVENFHSQSNLPEAGNKPFKLGLGHDRDQEATRSALEGILGLNHRPTDLETHPWNSKQRSSEIRSVKRLTGKNPLGGLLGRSRRVGKRNPQGQVDRLHLSPIVVSSLHALAEARHVAGSIKREELQENLPASLYGDPNSRIPSRSVQNKGWGSIRLTWLAREGGLGGSCRRCCARQLPRLAPTRDAPTSPQQQIVETLPWRRAQSQGATA